MNRQFMQQQSTSARSWISALAPALLVLGVGLSTPAHGDDTEIFFQVPTDIAVSKPSVLFILDTSASMRETVGFSNYDPKYPYPAKCDPNRIYWMPGSETPTEAQLAECNLPYIEQDWANESSANDYFKCQAAEEDMIAYGRTLVQGVAQWDGGKWVPVDVKQPRSTRFTECASDAGTHGKSSGDAQTYAIAGNRIKPADPGPWTSASGSALNYTGQLNNPFTFYAGNYLNCVIAGDSATVDEKKRCSSNPDDPDATDSKMNVLKKALWQLIETTNADVNLGFMRFDNNGADDEGGSANGGMVVHEIKSIKDNPLTFYDTLFVTTVKNQQGEDVQVMNPDGPSPIQETLYEAYRYYTGQTAVYGNNSRVGPTALYPSVDAALPEPKSKSNYIKPGDVDCNKRYIIIISDGTSTQDNGSTTEIQQLIGKTCLPDVPEGATPGPIQGDCINELAEYLKDKHDIITYTIGFDLSGSPYLQAAERLLADTGLQGGGRFATADSADELAAELGGMLADIIKQNTTFTSPTLTVNAFNRTRNLEDLFITVFQPKDRTRWVGNLKKYIVKPPKIATAGGEAVEQEIIYDAKNPAEIAVDPTEGFIDVNARSFWTEGFNDGAEVQLGGAANELPDPAVRDVYSNITGNGNGGNVALYATGNNPNSVVATNDKIENTDIGLPADATAEEREALINWARGADVDDDDRDENVTEQRYEMGDPLHAKPASVVYGVGGDPKDAVVFVATNDGYLHAFDPDDGSEHWTFIPKELLGRLSALRTNEPLAWDPPDAPDRTYGLDGSIRALKLDNNRNGIVDETDKVYLFFGMGRGGTNYYALDVTDREKPTLLWTIGPDITDAGKTLPGGGQSWSTPVPASVRIGSSEKLVLFFGGGYPVDDKAEDSETTYNSNSTGNRIFMVDALTGALLWSAGDSGTTLVLDEMTDAIPADLRVIDLTGDGLADRIYAGDLGGRVWRFDIFNGTEQMSDLIKGGVLASLGGAEQPASTKDNRRFYYAPDPSLITYGGQTWINIGIGSGHRGHPLDTSLDERFYSLRDRYPYTRWGTAPYDGSWKPITDRDTEDFLLDVTGDPVDGALDVGWTKLSAMYGWKMRLAVYGEPLADWTGEKVLAESRTFQNKLYFTTFAPKISPVECGARVGKNRLYVVNVVDAAPVGFEDGLPDNPVAQDRFTELGQAGIAPEVVFLFPEPEAGRVNSPQCLVGVVNCGTGMSNPPVRTYWRQRGAN